MLPGTQQQLLLATFTPTDCVSPLFESFFTATQQV
jgi:hypothetical protein